METLARYEEEGFDRPSHFRVGKFQTGIHFKWLFPVAEAVRVGKCRAEFEWQVLVQLQESLACKSQEPPSNIHLNISGQVNLLEENSKQNTIRCFS